MSATLHRPRLPDPDIHRRALKRLRLATLALLFVELTLIAQTVIEGLTASTGLTELLIVPLLVISGWLWLAGRRL